MTEADTTIHDYSTGAPRHHHSLYIDDGNLVLQVENAIFKVHRSFLAKQSSVIKDMLGTPQSSTIRDGTDEKPLVLTGDSAAGWGLLLELFVLLFNPNRINGNAMLSILPIAHKYCMDKIEAAVLEQLKGASTTPGYVDLMVAAQTVGSEQLYQQALNGLISSRSSQNLDLTQAKRIGVEATFAILTAPIPTIRQCLYCGGTLGAGNCYRCR